MRYYIEHTMEPAKMRSGSIECYPWGGQYRPTTTFRVGHDEKSLRVLMCCEEVNPLARVHERNGPVWCDSCMEFFVAPGLKRTDGYFNFEMNANGALLLHFGYSSDEYIVVDWPMASDLSLETSSSNGHWDLDLHIPFALFSHYVPDFSYKSGLYIHGNFFKCGDEADPPHFGCHFPVRTHEGLLPNFHQPDCFGELILV